jgi:hypothetical protein
VSFDLNTLKTLIPQDQEAFLFAMFLMCLMFLFGINAFEYLKTLKTLKQKGLQI